MIAQLSKRIASFFVHSRVIESENEQVYEYGLELLISTLLNGVIALVLALFSRTLWQCICFLVVFIFLRKSAGGFHAKTHLGCCSILAAVLGIFIVLIKFVHIEEYSIVSLAAVVFSIIMILLSELTRIIQPYHTGLMAIMLIFQQRMLNLHQNRLIIMHLLTA